MILLAFLIFQMLCVIFISLRRLDTRLYKFCHNDATNVCSAPEYWHRPSGSSEAMSPPLGPIVLSCLYRRIIHVSDSDSDNKEVNIIFYVQCCLLVVV